MTRPRRTATRAAARAGGAVALAALAALLGGCSPLGYYAQSVSGHLGIVRAARPVSDWLADPATPAPLRARLELAQRIRDFAVVELHEPDNASYRRYADLRRGAAVWNVVAAPELSLELRTWCFPVVGCVGYRGYFDRADAAAMAERLRADGLDVEVYGVPAYSTLGMLPGRLFADPLLNTFIEVPEGELARLIFHELAHQIAYAKGDTTFNESFATAVERIGVARWLDERPPTDADLDAPRQEAHQDDRGDEARAQDQRREARRHDFRALTMRYRDQFDALYRSPTSDAAKRQGKAALLAELRADYTVLKTTRWNGYAGYDRWFAEANNASFGVLAAYEQWVPAFERLFTRLDGDFPAFYAEVRRLAALPVGERHAELLR